MVQRIFLPALTPDEAQRIETLGDDGTFSDGILQRDKPTGSFFLKIPNTQEAIDDDSDHESRVTYSASCDDSTFSDCYRLRRFAKAYFSIVPDRTAEEAKRLLEFFPDADQTFLNPDEDPIRVDTVQVDTTTLRVATINIYKIISDREMQYNNRYDSDSLPVQDRLELLLADLQARDARGEGFDIIAFQEIMDVARFDQYRARAGYPYFTYFETSNGTQGDLAVWSRYPLSGDHFVPSPWYSSDETLCRLGRVRGFRYGMGVVTANVHGAKATVINFHNVPKDQPVSTGEYLYTGEFTPEDPRSLERQFYWVYFRDQFDSFFGQGGALLALGDLNSTHTDESYQVFLNVWGLRDHLRESQSEGIVVYDHPENPNQNLPRAVTYNGDHTVTREINHGDQGIIDGIFSNGGLENQYTYIDHETGDYTDHSAVVSVFQVPQSVASHEVPALRPDAWLASIPLEKLEEIRNHIATVEISAFCRDETRRVLDLVALLAGYYAPQDIISQRANALLYLDGLIVRWHSKNGR